VVLEYFGWHDCFASKARLGLIFVEANGLFHESCYYGAQAFSFYSGHERSSFEYLMELGWYTGTNNIRGDSSGINNQV
jgi:hypothetical protein